jgi:hypothetical protein
MFFHDIEAEWLSVCLRPDSQIQQMLGLTAKAEEREVGNKIGPKRANRFFLRALRVIKFR